MAKTTKEQIYELNQQIKFLKNVLQGDIIDPREADEIQIEIDRIEKEIKKLKGEA